MIGGELAVNPMDQLLGKSTDPLLSSVQVIRSRTLVGALVDSLGLRVRTGERDLLPSGLTDIEILSDTWVDTLNASFNAGSYTVRSKEGVKTAPYGSPVAFPHVRFSLSKHPGVPAAEIYVTTREQAIDGVLRTLRATRRENTDVVDLFYTSPDPLRASAVTNTLADLYQAANLSEAREMSRRRRVFLEQQLGTTDSLFADAQAALSAFRTREQLFSSRERLAAEQTALMGLDVRREELNAERQVYSTLLGRVGQQPGALQQLIAAPGLATNPAIAQLYTQYTRFRATRDSLMSGPWRSGPSQPDVARLDTLIRNVESDIVGAARSQVATIDARIRALDDLKDRNARLMASLPAAESEETRLLQQVEMARAISTQLREEYERARIAEAVEAG
jgi:uncharacterized protein involved in exopolysaccharide biosynthesis